MCVIRPCRLGVEQLRDDDLETYWQSDGPQPHLINVQFHKKVALSELLIYSDYKADESYTPAKLSLRTGTNHHDLQELLAVELVEPAGWISIKLQPPRGPREREAEAAASIRTNFLQIAILSNHQNGRDSHVRQVKVFGPLPPASEFVTNEFTRYAQLR